MFLAESSSKYDLKFIEIAGSIAELSKDPSTKVGAVIAGAHNQLISQGFNGFPRGVDDLDERYQDRETKYKFVVHAEANAIYNALHNGSKLEGSTIYINGLPCCNDCAKAIIQTGIKKVVQRFPINENTERWIDSASFTNIMFNEAGVIVVNMTE